MRREDAEELTRDSEQTRHWLRETWYCGLINQRIEKAAKAGQHEIRIRYSARSFPARHQHRMISLYEGEGYTVKFLPNYRQIEPTQWTMILSWKDRQT